MGGGDAFLILSFPQPSVTPCNLYPHGCRWLISVCTVASSFLRHLQEFFETSYFLRPSSQEFQIDPVSGLGVLTSFIPFATALPSVSHGFLLLFSSPDNPTHLFLFQLIS